MTVQGSVHSHRGTHRRSDQTPDPCQLHTVSAASFLWKGTISVKKCSAETLPCLPAVLARHEVVAQPAGTSQGREGQSHTARRGHSHSLHGTVASATGRGRGVLKVQTPKLEPYSWLHYSTYVDAVVWFPLTLQNSQARWGFFPSPLSPVSWTRWLLQFPSHTRHWTQIFAHDRRCK